MKMTRTPVTHHAIVMPCDPDHIRTILTFMDFLAACFASFSSAFRRASGAKRARRSYMHS